MMISPAVALLEARLASFDRWPFDYFAAMDILLPQYQGYDNIYNEHDYLNMEWVDPRPKPSWSEVVQAFIQYKGRIRLLLLKELNEILLAKEYLLYDGRHYPTDAYHLSQMTSAVSYLSRNPNRTKVKWVNVEDGEIELDADKFIDIHDQICSRAVIDKDFMTLQLEENEK